MLDEAEVKITENVSTGNNKGENDVMNSNGNIDSSIKGYESNQYAGNVQAGSSGYYVTAGVFGSRNNALKLQNKLRSQGMSSDIFQDSNNGMYYVFLLKFNNYDAADKACNSKFNGQYNGKLWIKVM